MGGQTAFTDYLTKLCQDPVLFDVTGWWLWNPRNESENGNSAFWSIQLFRISLASHPLSLPLQRQTGVYSLLLKPERARFSTWLASFPGDEDNGSLCLNIWAPSGSIRPVLENHLRPRWYSPLQSSTFVSTTKVKHGRHLCSRTTTSLPPRDSRPS